MTATSPVLQALGRLYAESKLGRTGAGQRDFFVDFKKLLKAAGCLDGDDRAVAVNDLRHLHGSVLFLESPRRDADIIHQVRLPLQNEAMLFELLGVDSPTKHRQRLAKQFRDASLANVPELWRNGWLNFCQAMASAALCGEGVSPFSRDDLSGNSELLVLIPRLLHWHDKGDESLLRFVSCALTSNSKRLGELALRDEEGRHCGKIGSVLARVTGGKFCCLEDLGILPSPRFVLAHGPMRMLLDGEWLNFGKLRGPFRIAEADIARAVQIETCAARCLTVENETCFHELAKLESGELLICTSYPGSATLALLRRLPDAMQFWHFGDSDPEGFDILRDLRKRSLRPFQSLHMGWRPRVNSEELSVSDKRLLQKLCGSDLMQSEREALEVILQAGVKGDFEQESLGKPTIFKWPFYSPNIESKHLQKAEG